MAKTKQLSRTNQNLHVQAVQKMHRGPLPSADDFAQYDAVLPGAAHRILSMAEEQSKHRQKLELIVVKQGSRDSLVGLIFGFLIGIFTIGGGIYCALQGKELYGLGISLSGLGSLVGVFVYGSRQRQKEREAKAQLVQ